MSGLVKELVSFPFTGGLDTKSDSKFVKPTKLLDLQNGVFSAPGSIKKRFGYTPFAASIAGGASIASAQAVMTLGNELLVADNLSLYSYDNALSKWINHGWQDTTGDQKLFDSVYVTQAAVIQDTYRQYSNDAATYNNTTRCYVWEDSRGGACYYRVVDLATGQLVVGTTAIATNSVKPKVLTVGTYFVMFWVDTTGPTLKCRTLDATSPTSALGGAVSLSGTNIMKSGTGKQNYDATTNGTDVYAIFYSDNGAGADQTAAVYLLITAGVPTIQRNAVLAADKCWAPTVFMDSFAGGPVFLYYNTDNGVGGGNVKLNAYNGILTVSLGTATYAAVFDSVTSLTGVCLSSQSLSLYLYIGRLRLSVLSTVQQASYFYTTGATVTGSYTLTARAANFTTVSPTGKAFAYANRAYCVVAYDLPEDNAAQGVTGVGSASNYSLEPTYFVIDQQGRQVAKILYSNGGGVPGRQQGYNEPASAGVASTYGSAMLPETSAGSSATLFQFTVLQQEAISVVNGAGVFSQTGITDVTLNFWDTQYSLMRDQAAECLTIGGGYPQLYDGANVVEQGFHVFPEVLYIQSGGGSGHTYSYVACYEWTDNKGNIHRSAPSPALTVKTTNAIANAHQVNVKCLGLGVTQKLGLISPVSVVWYRTTDGGAIYYRATTSSTPGASGSTNVPITNNQTIVSFVDGLDDATLVNGAPLYTTGGVVADVPPNACSNPVTFAVREWVILTDQDNALGYSKALVPNTPVEWGDGFIQNIDPRGGKITAIATMDDKLIIFKQRAIFYLTGIGPDDTGGQNDFGSGTMIVSDVGCIAPRSVLLTPDGLMFQSEKGIYLLDRALGVSYIGAQVEGRITFGTTKITGAYLQPNSQRAVFVSPNLSSGYALVYDYLMRQWSVSVSSLTTTLLPNDAAIWNDPTQGNTPILALPAGTVGGSSVAPAIKENYSGYSDVISVNSADHYINLSLTTAYMQLSQVQGYQRVYKLFLLGTFASNHQLFFAIDYDFAGTYAQQIFQTVTGSAGAPEQVRIFPSTQKCEALSLTVTDLGTGTYGQGLSLSDLALEVGIKRGGFRLPASQSTG